MASGCTACVLSIEGPFTDMYIWLVSWVNGFDAIACRPIVISRWEKSTPACFRPLARLVALQWIEPDIEVVHPFLAKDDIVAAKVKNTKRNVRLSSFVKGQANNEDVSDSVVVFSTEAFIVIG